MFCLNGTLPADVWTVTYFYGDCKLTLWAPVLGKFIA